MSVPARQLDEAERPAPMKKRPAAVIYTHSLLEGSMTFIKSQAEALVRYEAIYVGAHRVEGIALPSERTYVLNEHTALGVIRETVFRRYGWAPTLIGKLEAHEPRVVHAHFGTCGPAGMALAKALRVPLVVTFHGQDATMDRAEALRTHRGRELLNKKARLIEKTGIFIAVSDFIRRRLVEDGYPESKILVHRNGIDLDFFKPYGEAPRDPVILFVGRFVEKKGTKYLIEAARELRRTGVAFELVMLGGGPLEEDLKRAAAEAAIPCRFLGFLPVEEVRQWLGKARVVAIPSVTAANGDSEGLPTVLLEAQAMATPVVATYHSGIPEGVIAGVTAELVAERDVRGLAAQLRSFLESPAKAQAFGRAARDFVTREFDMHRQIAGLEHIYDRLAGRIRA